MNFINRHGFVKLIFFAATIHPFAIVPLVLVQRADDRRGSRWQLRRDAVGVCLVDHLAARQADAQFVLLAFTDVGYKEFPDAAWDLLLHGMRSAVPMIKVANDLDALCIGRPNGEVHADLAIHFANVRTEFFVDLPVLATSEKIAIKVR